MAAIRWMAVVLTCIFSFSSPVYSATVTQCGPTICYEYDNAQSGASMFGLPTLSGDALIFLSPMFRAESLNGGGLDTVQATFDIDRVYSLSGMEISDLTLIEFGDYDLIGGDEVTAELILDVENNNSAEFGSFQTDLIASGDSGGQQTWQLDGYFDPDSEFATEASDVSVSITDILTATTDQSGEAAWIQKKLTLSAATVVPAPAAIWLFLSGLGALGWARKRGQ